MGGGLYCCKSKYCDKKGNLVLSTIPSQAPWAMCIQLTGCVLTLQDGPGPVSLCAQGSILNLAGCKRKP